MVHKVVCMYVGFHNKKKLWVHVCDISFGLYAKPTYISHKREGILKLLEFQLDQSDLTYYYNYNARKCTVGRLKFQDFLSVFYTAHNKR